MELQHSTHSTQTTRVGGGVGGPERVGYTNIVPEEEKEGTIRGKKEIREEKRGGRKETAVSTISSRVQLVSSQTEY